MNMDTLAIVERWLHTSSHETSSLIHNDRPWIMSFGMILVKLGLI